MSFNLKDLEKSDAPVSFLKKGEVKVRIGPSSATFLYDQKIPLDGRRYICAGTIILKNDIVMPANFEIKTYTFDFLVHDSVFVFVEKEQAWYSIDEQELYIKLGVSKEEAIPYQWLPDRPLDYYKSGPYPMKW